MTEEKRPTALEIHAAAYERWTQELAAQRRARTELVRPQMVYDSWADHPPALLIMAALGAAIGYWLRR